MAGSVNKVILVGNVGKDPESRSFQNGGKVVSFSVATSENWKDKNSGERKDKTEWHNIVSWNDGLNTAVIMKYLHKGSRVYVEGQIRSRQYQDKENVTRYITEIYLETLTMLDPKPASASAATADAMGVATAPQTYVHEPEPNALPF